MTHTNSPARPVAQIPARAVTAVVGLLVFFELTSGVLQAGITPLLPDLAAHLDIGTADTNWIISVQLLAAAVCVPLFGRLGDLYGHRRMLRIALVVTAAGTLIVALADSYPVLLAGRLLQGPLAALLPLEIALVRDRLPVAEARRAIALLVGSLALGSLVGGLALALVHSASGDLRLTLLIPAALALVCVPVSYIAVPESAHRASGRVDWPGVSLLSAAVLALLSGVGAAKNGAWGSPAVLGPLLLGVLLLIIWILVELRAAEPLVDLRALAGREAAPSTSRHSFSASSTSAARPPTRCSSPQIRRRRDTASPCPPWPSHLFHCRATSPPSSAPSPPRRSPGGSATEPPW